MWSTLRRLMRQLPGCRCLFKKFANLCFQRPQQMLRCDVYQHIADEFAMKVARSWKLNLFELKANKKCSVDDVWKNTELITAKMLCFSLSINVLVIVQRHKIRWCFIHSHCSTQIKRDRYLEERLLNQSFNTNEGGRWFWVWALYKARICFILLMETKLEKDREKF